MSPTGTEESRVSTIELALFTRQMGAMLDQGVDVLRALRIASQHSRNPMLISAAKEIGERLSNGREFHEALGPYPQLFDPFYVEMARQGETDGLLGKALLSVADYLDQVSARDMTPAAAAPTPAATSPVAVAGLTMTILGVQAFGAAALWAIATARPEILSLQWTGPLAAFWCAFCLLSGSWVLGNIRRNQAQQTGATAAPKPAPLPPKTTARKSAETEAVVRNALMDQQEEREAPKQLYLNGHARPKSDISEFLPDGDAPRFD